MDKTWRLEEAEGHLSELVQDAQMGEVQVITKGGERAVVVLDYVRYLALSQPKNLLTVLRGEPPYQDDLRPVRDKGLGRPSDLE